MAKNTSLQTTDLSAYASADLPVTLGDSGLSAASMREIEVMMTIARKFPRREDHANAVMLSRLDKYPLAEKARYKWVAGGSEVIGLTAVFANDFRNLWGHVKGGIIIVDEDEQRSHVRGFSWDLQTNVWTQRDEMVKKLIPRKVKQGNETKLVWRVPDEREKLMLIMSRGSRLARSAFLDSLPFLMKSEFLSRIEHTLQRDAEVDPDAKVKVMIDKFSKLKVFPDDIELYLGHELRFVTPDEIVELRDVYAALTKEGVSWTTALHGKRPELVEKPKTDDGKSNPSLTDIVNTGGSIDEDEPVGD